VNGGPAAARNTGLAAVHTEFVALLDSDCVPPTGWIDELVGHFADPMVAAVAPRVLATAQSTLAGRYGAVRGSLDMGGQPAIVRAGTLVSYVPTAALLVRRSALPAVVESAGSNPTAAIFDEALRYGEDVDLVWRLIEAGWVIRYDPSVEMGHHEPDCWRTLLARRFHYGTSAAPLAARHPGALAPLALLPWPAASVTAALSGHLRLAVGGVVAHWLNIREPLRRAGLPPREVRAAAVATTRQTWLGVARYGTQFAMPVLVLAMLPARRPLREHATGAKPPSHGAAARRLRRLRFSSAALPAAALLLSGPAISWHARRPQLNPIAFTLAHVADDVAYGAGVWVGSLRARSAAALKPRFVLRPFRKTR
jgi:mycofactocin system glycosyltransferase